MSPTLAHCVDRLTFGFAVDHLGCRRKPIWINVFVLAIALPVVSIWAIYRIFTTHSGPGVWLLALGLYIFTLFGVTLGNHRYWTHRGYKVRRPMRVVLAVASAMAVQGTIQQWVTTHRRHHSNSDVIGVDPHSPFEYAGWHGLKGLIWAQGIWLLFDEPVHQRPHRDLATDQLVQIQRRAFPYLAAGQFIVLAALYPYFGWNGVIIAGALRVTTLLTTTGLVNSVCHRWGSPAVDSSGLAHSRDVSRNNTIVAILTGGEGNHGWHHADPTCPRHGRKIVLDPAAISAGLRPDRGWRPDATWRLIQLLVAVRLIYAVRQPTTHMHFEKSPQLGSIEPGVSRAA